MRRFFFFFFPIWSCFGVLHVFSSLQTLFPPFFPRHLHLPTCTPISKSQIFLSRARAEKKIFWGKEHAKEKGMNEDPHSFFFFFLVAGERGGKVFGMRV